MAPADIATEDPLLQLTPVPEDRFVDRLRAGFGRRALAFGLVVLVEGLMLLLLLSFGAETPPIEEPRELTVINIQAEETSPEAPEPASPERAEPTEESQPPTRAMRPPQPAEPEPEPAPAPAPRVIIPMPNDRPLSVPGPAVRPSPPAGPVYGPPDRGGSSLLRDTERVGTAPNGEPLYAAAWYREPRPDQLRAYLSTATGPGWGLIACRTAPEYRVEDCVGLAEHPEGSQINRAILAAAWEFRVRPPRRGGQSMVGAWVRIRIDYSIHR